MTDWNWLIAKLEEAAASDHPEKYDDLFEVAAKAIERLQGTVAHVRENWMYLINAPDHTAEYVADVWLKNEQIEQTIPYHDEWKMIGMRTRLASVIGRARVDGGIAARKTVATGTSP